MATKTPAIVELFHSGVWNDVTAAEEVYTRDPISITHYPPTDPTKANRPPSQLRLTLVNTTGKYSPRNPMSPLFGLIGRNTPIRVSAKLAADTWTRVTASSWGTADSGQVWAGASSVFSSTGTAGRITHSSTGNLFNTLNDTAGIDDAMAQSSIRIGTKLTGSGAVYPQMLLRFQDSANYYTFGLFYQASGTPTGPVGLVMGKVVGGVFTSLYSNFGLTVYNGSETLNLKAEVVGTTLRIKAWNAAGVEPLAWTAEATDTTFTTGSFAVVSSKDAGVTSVNPTIDFDNLTVRNYLFHGEVEAWPQRSNVKGNDAWVSITAYGISRRLSAPGTSRPKFSALRRDITDPTEPVPVAYWPLEEGRDAPVPLPYKGLGLPGIINYAPAWRPGQADGPTGTLSLAGTTPRTVLGSVGPRFGRGITLPVPVHAAGVEVFTMHVRWRPFDSPKQQDGATFADLNHRLEFNGGGVRGVRIYLQSTPSSNANVNVFFWDPVFNLLGTPDTLISTIDVDDGNWHEIQVRMVQSGGNINTQLWTDGTLAASSTITAVTMGIIREVVLGASATYDTGLVVGQLLEGPFEASHVTVHNDNAVGQFYQSMIGYTGEKAVDRITRLCAQSGIPVTIIGTAAESEPVGPQRPLPTLDLLYDAADADGGHLYDSRENVGLTFRTRKTLYNQAVTMALDYAAGDEVAPPLDPVEDTDATANDVTVTRYQGGSANVVQQTGPLNVQSPPAGVGRYEKDVQRVFATDDQCLQAAAWIKGIGTWDEARFPVVNLDLTAMTEAAKNTLMRKAAGLNVGDRFTIANPPAGLPPEALELLALGFSALLESHHWTIAVNAVPALPYDVYTVQTNTANLSRIPAPLGGTTVNGALTTTATSMPILSTAVRWIDSAAFASQFPFDVMVAGERMRVTAITGTGLSQTATVTRSINGIVKTHAVGEAVQLFRPPVIAR